MSSALSFEPAQIIPGSVVLVGGGPGDPELITVAGLRALHGADVILYDRLAPTSLLDGLDAECVNVGKVPRGAHTPQETTNQMLIDYARDGKRVVRFKGGDSFVFGRGGEEVIALAEAGIQVTVIPGVTSSVAAPELAGIPVTHRGLSQGVTVVAGHVKPDDERCTVNWSALAKTNTTIVVLMGVKYLPDIVKKLLDSDLAPDTPAAVVSSAATDQQSTIRARVDEIVNIATREAVTPPSITVIGAVAGLDLKI